MTFPVGIFGVFPLVGKLTHMYDLLTEEMPPSLMSWPAADPPPPPWNPTDTAFSPPPTPLFTAFEPPEKNQGQSETFEV